MHDEFYYFIPHWRENFARLSLEMTSSNGFSSARRVVQCQVTALVVEFRLDFLSIECCCSLPFLYHLLRSEMIAMLYSSSGSNGKETIHPDFLRKSK